MAESLLDKIESKDNNLPVAEPKEKKPVVNRMRIKSGVKDKSVSLKVNSQIYTTFTEICKAQGLSNNSCLNMIISEYVRENSYLLEEF